MRRFPDSRHGIVLAKNEKAKKFGVQTAETIWQARRKCPNLVLAPPHREEYVKYSRLVNEIYLRYTDQVEPFSIDESWLDVTGSGLLFGSGPEIADELRRVVEEETGLTISVGVSFNKTLAKLGSDYKKPNATTVLSRDTYRTLLYPLPVDRLLFVGKKRGAAAVPNRHPHDRRSGRGTAGNARFAAGQRRGRTVGHGKRPRRRARAAFR